MTTQPQKHLFTVDEFYRMAEAGIFTEDDRVELIEGEIVEMTPIGVKHADCVRWLNRLFSRELGDEAILDVQNPVRLGERSEPQPDLALLKPPRHRYAETHPGPKDVLLIIEVADASRQFDRQTKVPLYAKYGIPEVWLVDLIVETIELYREPTSAGYKTVQTFERGTTISCEALPNVRLTVNDLLTR